MKIFIVAYLLLTVGVSYHQQQQPEHNKPEEKKSDATLEETTDWLKEKLITSGGFTENKGNETKIHKVEEATIQNCSFTIKTVETGQLRMRTLIRTTITNNFSLSEIDPGNIEVQTVDGKPVVKLVTLQGKKGIKTNIKIIAPAFDHNQSANKDELVLKFQDRDIAERVAKAFAHAATLCKGKKEPF